MTHPKFSRDENNNKLSNEIEANRATTVRHLILIRHGQYNVNGQRDEDRVLTKLGKLQADYTGKRLKELGLSYTKIVKSTMSRAQETGTIISTSLPEIPVKNCDLLREGAPIPPEPPIGSWKQEMYVSNTNLKNCVEFIHCIRSFLLMVLELRLLFASISIELNPNNRKIRIQF